MEDIIVKRPIGVLHDMQVKVDSFIFMTDFVILNCEVYHKVPIIFERPFLATAYDLVDIKIEKMKFRLDNEHATFDICRSMKQSGEIQSVLPIYLRSESALKVKIEEILCVEALIAVIINFEGNFIKGYDELLVAIDR